MKERISGWISLLGGIGIVLLILAFVFKEGISNDYYSFIITLTVIIYCASTVSYVIWTNFGNKIDSKIEKIEIENELLKKQIEQRELKKKLEED